jgi:PAS domain S-box-containing protein
MFRLRHVSGATRRLLLIYTALPVSYIITGRLGLFLAVSPGYATAVFLPAGIAITAMFMAGAATLPATFFGSLLLNVWIGYSLAHHFDTTSVSVALIIALASVLQAAFGGAVLRKTIGYPAPLDNPRDLLLFLLLSPIFCLTSASCSLGGMLALGAVQREELAVNWMTWWIGDTLGVLVALPLMLVLAGEPRTLWRLRSWFVAVPMILCFTLFVAIFVRVSSWENEQSLLEFRMRSQQLADTIKANFEEQALFLAQLSNVFINHRFAVDRHFFHELVQTLLRRFPAIQAVEWAPRVLSDNRKAFELAEQAELPGFAIREADGSNRLQPAGDRNHFYPVTYLEPFEGNEAAAGFDLASDGRRSAAIEAATSSGGAITTAPIRLVQEQGEQAGVLLIHAVSGDPGGPGIVLVVLRMGTSKDINGIIVSWNRGAQRLFGYSPDEVVGKPITILMPPERQEEGPQILTRIRRGEGIDHCETVRQRKDGGLVDIALTVSPLRDVEGKVVGASKIARDITERKRVERALRAREAELETVISRTPFMLIRCSPDLRYRFVSPAYAEMLGRRREDVIGRPIVDIIGEEGFKTILPHINKVLAGERAEYEGEVQYQSIGKRFLHGVYTPDKDDQGEVIGWIASILDVTERRRAEAQRDLLIAEVNHRVKNTLATVISIAHQSFSEDKSFEDAQDSFNSRIRALAQSHTRLADANWSGISLETIVRDETAPYRNGSNVNIVGPGVILNPKCAVSLGMAIHELTTNAAKYGALSAKNGWIQVSWETAPSDNEVRITWIERGGPIVRLPRRSGFGRRLLEQALAADLDGTVKLDFREEGLSCLIAFPLNRFTGKTVERSMAVLNPIAPVCLPSLTPMAADRSRPKNADLLSGVRVLIVEDEALLALEIQELLQSAGSTIVGTFNDLARAGQVARREAIDVAVLDTNLNGEMVYPLADDLAVRGIPFVFVTGYATSNLPERFRGMPQVAKPFDPTSLTNELQRMMGKEPINPASRGIARESIQE